MNPCEWPQHFHRLHDQAVALYREGQRDPARFFARADLDFLAQIGCSAPEIYDFAEDFVQGGDPDFDTALLITAVRRDYFLVMQKGKITETIQPESTLPLRQDELGGIAWLPRIIEKARRKLAGTLSSDVMYDCGGDRRFLREHRIHPADFLRRVWAAQGDDSQILAWVRDSKNADPTR